MRVVLLGTPAFAVPTLEALAAAPDIELRGVICQPDRPAGRAGALRAPEVKRAAAAQGLPVFQPERIKSAEAAEWLAALQPEALAVVAYGQILPARVFAKPRWGAINAHASLLPKYRGAAPVQWAIANGEAVSGVTAMQIEAGLDTGPMLLRREAAIGPAETAPELSARLAAMAAEVMLAALRGLAAGTTVPRAQNEAEASVAPLLKRGDAMVDWDAPAGAIYNRWRGFQPWPGIASRFRGQRLQVLACGAVEGRAAPPGQLEAWGGELRCACGEGWLRLDRVQLEGRRAITGTEFARGARLEAGERVG